MNAKIEFDTFPLQVRELQARHDAAHKALVNWGAWSRDDPQRPQGIRAPSVWDQVKRDETEAYGDREDAEVIADPEEPAKAEAGEKEAYNQLRAEDLNDRIHASGGLPDYVRLVLRVAYVFSLPEEQYVREARAIEWRWQLENAGCTKDGFLERLEEGLRFVGRFV